jgi:hypothetical protein
MFAQINCSSGFNGDINDIEPPPASMFSAGIPQPVSNTEIMGGA